MSAKFHLRPVATLSDGSTSPSTSTASERSPRFNHRPSAQAAPRGLRRPLSPSSLRDVDLSSTNDASTRRYPAPPTGHELMALFPAAPPTNHRPGPTSGYFLQQERNFFAQKGKEIVRVQIEVDMPRDDGDQKSRARDPAAPRQWTAAPPNGVPPHATAQRSPLSHSPPPQFAPPSAGRRGVPVVPVSAQPVYPGPPSMHAVHTHPAAPSPVDVPHAGYPMRPAQEPAMPAAALGKQVELHPDDYRDDPDEAWRRPMPHNERRRAGKHTKRVIVNGSCYYHTVLRMRR
ncbi:uncharacterized protein LAESUDRAFT_559837 [Laetiporus sulphureus 93-53]|uniref:Uncharacterized protein n=1 Tax=Laetiporus sulphureus 93-53 TaxID=1314785 RepID=A0A165B5C2_9APHY|nr:uncharacterized protein LAESUDRAFT_559837 [Laetiporus sulphureus 93-53]KZT00273.1 hypothetical protein LAESUDRAFT_559837 [Laetiporus sulphureus 93-53]